MPSNFYGCLRHEMCCSEDCSKITKFWAKTTSHGYRRKILTTFNYNPDLFRKVITVDESWVYVYDIETKAKSSQSFTVFTGRGPHWLFRHPKTENTDQWKAFSYDWGDKRKIETGAVGDTKKRASGVLWGLKKTLT